MKRRKKQKEEKERREGGGGAEQEEDYVDLQLSFVYKMEIITSVRDFKIKMIGIIPKLFFFPSLGVCMCHTDKDIERQEERDRERHTHIFLSFGKLQFQSSLPFILMISQNEDWSTCVQNENIRFVMFLINSKHTIHFPRTRISN